jgi:hypothetical protein
LIVLKRSRKRLRHLYLIQFLMKAEVLAHESTSDRYRSKYQKSQKRDRTVTFFQI